MATSYAVPLQITKAETSNAALLAAVKAEVEALEVLATTVPASIKLSLVSNYTESATFYYTQTIFYSKVETL